MAKKVCAHCKEIIAPNVKVTWTKGKPYHRQCREKVLSKEYRK